MDHQKEMNHWYTLQHCWTAKVLYKVKKKRKARLKSLYTALFHLVKFLGNANSIDKEGTQ